jgi:hypothetical protein
MGDPATESYTIRFLLDMLQFSELSMIYSVQCSANTLTVLL